MKKFTVTRNLFEGDNYKCFQEFETEALFLEWAATKKHLGRKDSWAQASTDIDGNEKLPSDLVDPQQSRVRTENQPAYVGQDQDGNDVNYEAYSYDVTEYLQTDQWSYTVEDLEPLVAIETWQRIRSERDSKLAESDFSQLADSPFTSEEKAEYRAYRTYLRNITTSYDDITILIAVVKDFNTWKEDQV